MGSPDRVARGVDPDGRKPTMGGPRQESDLRQLNETLDRFRFALLAVLVAAFFAQALDSARRASITWDEYAFIPAGYSYVATGDLRMNREQPPLMKYLYGLPGLALRPNVPTEHESWTSVDRGARNTQWAFGKHFLTEANDNGKALIFWARFMTALVASLMCIAVYAWARALYGTLAGLLAALLVATSPNLIAHGGLATTDLGVAAFTLFASFAYWRAVRDPNPVRFAWGRFVVAGCAFAGALLTKFSGIFLAPVFAGYVILHPFLEGGSAPLAERIRKARPIAIGTAIVFGVGFVLVTLAYLAPGRIDLYFRSMFEVGFNVSDSARNYLLGTYREERFPHYFLVAFLVKTPLWTLLLLVARVAVAPKHDSDSLRDLYLLLAPVAAFFFVISWKAPNIGLRYILPVYPLLFVYISGIVATRAFELRQPVRIAVGVLAAYAVVGALRFPSHPLAYFNDAVGGPRQGIRYLEHSNLDWGQDFIRLADYLDENDVGRVRFVYPAHFSHELYGIDAERVSVNAFLQGQPGTYVIGIKTANRTRRPGEGGREISLLDTFEPVARVGSAFLVYEVPESSR